MGAARVESIDAEGMKRKLIATLTCIDNTETQACDFDVLDERERGLFALLSFKRYDDYVEYMKRCKFFGTASNGKHYFIAKAFNDATNRTLQLKNVRRGTLDP